MRTSINLMTEDDIRSRMLHDSRQLWTHILLLTAAVLLVMGAYQVLHSPLIGSELRQLEDQYAPMQALKDECIRMRTNINGMRDAQQLMLRLVDTRPVTTLMGAVSQAATETSGGVFIQSLEVLPPTGPDQQRRAIVQGMGQDNASIASFMAALRASQLFDDVTLSSSSSSHTEVDVATSFHIECQL